MRWWRWKISEWIAACYLRIKGYRILQRNVRIDGVEVDIVAWRAAHLILVEVKFRTHQQYGRPEDAVGRERRRRQWRAGLSLMHRISLPVRSVGFGVVAMTHWRLWFLEDAWDFDDL